MKNYSLQTYKGIATRHTCPNCGDKRSFAYYVDEENTSLHPSVGRCNHESSCGYNYTPKQYFLLFQYAMYPVDGCTLFLDTESVFGIVLHHFACTHLAILVYLPKDNSTVTGRSQTILIQQAVQHRLRLAAIVVAKQYREKAEEVTLYAFRLLHIMNRNTTDGRRLRWLGQSALALYISLLPVKRRYIRGTAFGMIQKVLLGSVMIPTAAFVVASSD